MTGIQIAVYIVAGFLLAMIEYSTKLLMAKKIGDKDLLSIVTHPFYIVVFMMLCTLIWPAIFLNEIFGGILMITAWVCKGK